MNNREAIYMIKNILRVLSANVVIAIIGLVSSLFLPKILSIEDYALYQTFVLYMSYIAILHLGFPTGMNIKYAGKLIEDIDKSQYRAEMRIIMMILAFFSGIGLIISLITKEKMLLYISLMIFFYCFSGSFSLLVQAWGQFNTYAIMHIIMSAGPLVMPIIIYIVSGNASADICIIAYVAVYALISLGCLLYHGQIIKGCPSSKIISRGNWETEKLGFYFLLGNYINSLFHSIDKQFVKWFCLTREFSYYSFGLTMQSTMTIFITAISQPLFPYMASGKIKGRKQQTKVKRFLLILGSLSGLAYFACALVVKYWIPNYVNSIQVIRVYFAVFPAMAVINCLYFNMYKINKMTHRYIADLATMLVGAAAANYIAIKLGYGYLGVAFATTILNYLWLLYGTIVFKDLRLNFREVLFLFLFLVEFVIIPQISLLIVGAVVYLICDVAICAVCFPDEIKAIFEKMHMNFNITRS